MILSIALSAAFVIVLTWALVNRRRNKSVNNYIAHHPHHDRPTIGGKHFTVDREPQIGGMRVGETGYTQHWAFSLGYHVTKEHDGASDTPIVRTRDGFNFIGEPGTTIEAATKGREGS